MRRLLPSGAVKAIVRQLGLGQSLRSRSPVRVLYQVLTDKGAFGYIDRGFVNGYRLAGADVLVWDSRRNEPDLRRILAEFRPTHFIGYLQEGGSRRLPSAWLLAQFFPLLRSYKDRQGLFVAVRSNPSNIRQLFQNCPIDFSRFPEAGVSGFYLQAERPVEVERAVFDTGFVDLIRSPLAHHVYPTVFKNYLDLGLPLLEEPHAADIRAYPPGFRAEGIDNPSEILYVGGCWPFKWQNMAPYINALRLEFGERFVLYGRGWPDDLSRGVLAEELYNQVVADHAIQVALHEPSQVLDFPFAGNERIFKLLAMGCFVISDPNPLLDYHFRVGEEIVVAESPEDMVARIHQYLGHPDEMVAIGEAGQRRVLRDHTYQVRAQRLLTLSRQADFPAVMTYK